MKKGLKVVFLHSSSKGLMIEKCFPRKAKLSPNSLKMRTKGRNQKKLYIRYYLQIALRPQKREKKYISRTRSESRSRDQPQCQRKLRILIKPSTHVIHEYFSHIQRPSILLSGSLSHPGNSHRSNSLPQSHPQIYVPCIANNITVKIFTFSSQVKKPTSPPKFKNIRLGFV